jgi:hypothetical protein
VNPYLMSLPTVLVSIIFVFIVLRDLRRANRADAASKAEYERRMAEFAQERAECEAAVAALLARSQAELVVKLEMMDEDAVPDLLSAFQETRPLVMALSQHERSLGGSGLTLTGAKVEPGAVRLTFSPVERLCSAARVQRIADEVNNAAPPLPPSVTAAYAHIQALELHRTNVPGVSVMSSTHEV